LAVLYYYKTYENTPAMTVEALRAGLVRARVPKASKINIASVLTRSGERVDNVGSENGRRVWALTGTGEQYVRQQLGLPESQVEVEHDVATLTALSAKVPDDVVRGYVEEAIKCLQAGALRAAVVFLWTGAIRTLHEEALAKTGPAAVTTAIQTQDSRIRPVSKLEHFGWVNDRAFLAATPDLGLLDKGQKDTLVDALNLRNRCGHPTQYKPGEAKARSFIEDVVGIVFA
jgi:hypothetical protein